MNLLNLFRISLSLLLLKVHNYSKEIHTSGVPCVRGIIFTASYREAREKAKMKNEAKEQKYERGHMPAKFQIAKCSILRNDLKITTMSTKTVH